MPWRCLEGLGGVALCEEVFTGGGRLELKCWLCFLWLSLLHAFS